MVQVEYPRGHKCQLCALFVIGYTSKRTQVDNPIGHKSLLNVIYIQLPFLSLDIKSSEHVQWQQ